MKILWIGDVVGSPGRRIFKSVARELRAANAVHAIIVNAENSAGGSGITDAIAAEFFDAGADVITLGDHTFGQKLTEPLLEKERRLIRPANYPPAAPGRGVTTVQTALGAITVIQLLGRVFMQPVDCPFRAVDEILAKLPAGAMSGPIFVEVHAEATSEKIALGRYLDGRVAAVAGTHTHVQTNDARIFPGGTAFICDLGMTGPEESVIGREVAPVLQKFITSVPARFEVASGPTILSGALLEIDRVTGKAIAIEPFVRRAAD